MIAPFMQTTRCIVSTLSPVHIGCGEDYYPTNYVIEGGLLHHFSEEGLLAALNFPEKQGLAKIAEEQNDRNDSGIKKLQEFIYGKRETLQRYATHSVPLSEALENFYKSRIGKTSQRESQGRNVNNQLNIARHAFNPYNQTPYFAGSSIKGAIRTALLNAINDNEPLQSKLDELKITDKNKRPFIINDRIEIPKYVNGKLQEHLLGYQAISDNPERGIKGDPLRLLKIGDATYAHADHLNAAEIRFAVNRKNKPSKKQSMAEGKGLYQLLECLPANRSRSLNFDLSFLGDKNSQYRWTLRDICQSCNDFFVPQLESELIMLQQLNYANTVWVTGLEKLLANELREAFKNQQAFLLRVGQHGGAESNTLDGVRHIHIPQHKKYLPKPTTVWLAGNYKDQQHDLLPFGWVVVEIGDAQLDKTHAFLKAQAAPDYQRQEQLQALASQRAEFLAQAQQKQAIKAQQEAQAAEQARLQAEAEAIKAAQLAEMTEAQRVIFELRQEYEKATPKTQPISGTLNPKLTAVINQATDWSSEDKQSLFELGNEMNKKLWNSNSKVKNRLKPLQG